MQFLYVSHHKMVVFYSDHMNTSSRFCLLQLNDINDYGNNDINDYGNNDNDNDNIDKS